MGEVPAHVWCQPWQIVLGCRRKQDEQASKQCSSMASASVPAFRFLPCVPDLVCKPNKPLPPQVAFGQNVSSEQQGRTEMKGLQPCLATQCLPFTLVGLSVTVRAQWTQREPEPQQQLGRGSRRQPCQGPLSRRPCLVQVRKRRQGSPWGLL